MNRLIVMLGLWLLCMVGIQAGEPVKAGFTHMERSHIRVHTPELFSRGNSVDIHLECLADSQFCFPLPGGKVISAYGSRGGHSGADIKTKANDSILCVFDGVVRMAKSYGGYGKVIVVRHFNGLETVYSHNSKNFVAPGDSVKAGQVIGLTGRPGRATTEHLHFEVSFGGRRLDPAIIYDHAKHQLKPVTLHLTKGRGVKSVKNR